jgi:hypothetical protein
MNVNKMSETYFRKIVDEVLREDAREEGFQILNIGLQNRGDWEKELKDAVDYYNVGEAGYNIVCIALDFAKYKLVNANLMKQKPGDAFGNVAWMFENTESND